MKERIAAPDDSAGMGRYCSGLACPKALQDYLGAYMLNLVKSHANKLRNRLPQVW